MTKNKAYKLKIQIGRKSVKGKVFRFETDDPVKEIQTIDVPKLVEPVLFRLETEGKVAEKWVRANRARLAFFNELNAYHIIKMMHWMLK